MNREQIREALEAFPYPKSEYWVVAGGAMVLYGIRPETGDIDLGCTRALADRLEADGYLNGRTDDGRRRFRCGEKIEVFEEWLCGSVCTVDGLNAVSIDGLIAMKTELNREKDRRDLALIRAFLERTGN